MSTFLRMKDEDGLFRHSVLMLVVTHAGSVANLLFHVVMGRTLSKAEYGILVSLLGATLVVTTPMLAIQNTVAHFAGRYVQEQRWGDIAILVHRWTVKVLGLCLPLIALVLFLRGPVTAFFQLDSSLPVVVTALGLIGAVLVPVFTGVLQGGQYFGWVGAVSCVWSFIRLVLGAACVYYWAPRAVFGMATHGLGVFISLLIGILAFFWVVPKGVPSEQPLEKSDRYFFLSILSLFAFSVLMNADAMLVKHFFSHAEDYGGYARASTIARTMVFLSQPIAGAMFPKVIARGEWSSGHARTLFKALGLAGLMIGSAVALCALFPQLPLLILFKEHASTPEMLRLVRVVTAVMAPLGLVYMMMNFEMAQHRFGFLVPLTLCAAAFIGGVFLFHQTLWQVVMVFSAVSIGAFVSLTVVLFRQGKERASS